MNINATLFFQIIVFLLLTWFIARFVWKPCIRAIDERRQKIADGLSAADRAKTELADVGMRVEKQLADTRAESVQRLSDAERLAQSIVNEAKARATEEAKKIVEMAHVEAQQQANQARDALREQVAALAVKGAEHILRKEVDAKAHAELLERLKTEL